MRELRRVSQRSWSVFPIRFMRDVLASALATGIATIAFSHLTREPAPVQPAAVTPAGKVAERLDWDGGDAPDRSLRLAETVAMFSLPQADARTWSERIVAPQAEPAAAKPAAKAAVPRIAEYEAKQQRRTSLPPSRPVVLASAEAPVAPAAAKPGPRAAKEPIKVLGWSVPGSDLLPSGKDALDTVAALGGKVLAIGEKAVPLPGKIGSLGSTASEPVAWR